jgi:hypothetical protein
VRTVTTIAGKQEAETREEKPFYEEMCGGASL